MQKPPTPRQKSFKLIQSLHQNEEAIMDLSIKKTQSKVSAAGSSGILQPAKSPRPPDPAKSPTYGKMMQNQLFEIVNDMKSMVTSAGYKNKRNYKSNQTQAVNKPQQARRTPVLNSNSFKKQPSCSSDSNLQTLTCNGFASPRHSDQTQQHGSKLGAHSLLKSPQSSSGLLPQESRNVVDQPVAAGGPDFYRGFQTAKQQQKTETHDQRDGSALLTRNYTSGQSMVLGASNVPSNKISAVSNPKNNQKKSVFRPKKPSSTTNSQQVFQTTASRNLESKKQHSRSTARGVESCDQKAAHTASTKHEADGAKTGTAGKAVCDLVDHHVDLLVEIDSRRQTQQQPVVQDKELSQYEDQELTLVTGDGQIQPDKMQKALKTAKIQKHLKNLKNNSKMQKYHSRYESTPQPSKFMQKQKIGKEQQISQRQRSNSREVNAKATEQTPYKLDESSSNLVGSSQQVMRESVSRQQSNPGQKESNFVPYQTSLADQGQSNQSGHKKKELELEYLIDQQQSNETQSKGLEKNSHFVSMTKVNQAKFLIKRKQDTDSMLDNTPPIKKENQKLNGAYKVNPTAKSTSNLKFNRQKQINRLDSAAHKQMESVKQLPKLIYNMEAQQNQNQNQSQIQKVQSNIKEGYNTVGGLPIPHKQTPGASSGSPPPLSKEQARIQKLNGSIGGKNNLKTQMSADTLSVGLTALHQNDKQIIDEPNIYGQKNAIAANPQKSLQSINFKRQSVVDQYKNKRNKNQPNEIQVIGSANVNAKNQSNFYKINSQEVLRMPSESMVEVKKELDQIDNQAVNNDLSNGFTRFMRSPEKLQSNNITFNQNAINFKTNYAGSDKSQKQQDDLQNNDQTYSNWSPQKFPQKVMSIQQRILTAKSLAKQQYQKLSTQQMQEKQQQNAYSFVPTSLYQSRYNKRMTQSAAYLNHQIKTKSTEEDEKIEIDLKALTNSKKKQQQKIVGSEVVAAFSSPTQNAETKFSSARNNSAGQVAKAPLQSTFKLSVTPAVKQIRSIKEQIEHSSKQGFTAQQKLLIDKGIQHKKLSSGQNQYNIIVSQKQSKKKLSGEKQLVCSPFLYAPVEAFKLGDNENNKQVQTRNDKIQDVQIKKYLQKRPIKQSQTVKQTKEEQSKKAGKLTKASTFHSSLALQNSKKPRKIELNKLNLFVVGIRETPARHLTQPAAQTQQTTSQIEPNANDQPESTRNRNNSVKPIYINMQTGDTGGVGEPNQMILIEKAKEEKDKSKSQWVKDIHTFRGGGTNRNVRAESSNSCRTLSSQDEVASPKPIKVNLQNEDLGPSTIKASSCEDHTLSSWNNKVGSATHKRCESKLSQFQPSDPGSKSIISIRDDQMANNLVEKRSSQTLVKKADSLINLVDNVSFMDKKISEEELEVIDSEFESCVESEQINADFIQSNPQVQDFYKLAKKAFDRAQTLPSVSEKKGNETNRLFFKRRHTVERTNLIIFRVSDLMLQVKRDFQDGKSFESILIRPTCLHLISQLFATNQVALLLDLPDTDLTAWVNQMLVEELKLQVDAIYCLSSKYRPTELLLDLTQIVEDFRLFSEFQQSYKHNLANPSLFNFVELSVQGAPRVQLLCNDVFAHDYTHVRLGSQFPFSFTDQKSLEESQRPILSYLINNQITGYDSLTKISEVSVCINAQNVQIAQLVKRSQMLYMQTQAMPALIAAPFKPQVDSGKEEELSQLLSELRQRNAHVARKRANFATQYSGNRQVQLAMHGGFQNYNKHLMSVSVENVTFRNDDSIERVSSHQDIQVVDLPPTDIELDRKKQAISNLSSVINLENPFRQSNLGVRESDNYNDSPEIDRKIRLQSNPKGMDQPNTKPAYNIFRLHNAHSLQASPENHKTRDYLRSSLGGNGRNQATPCIFSNPSDEEDVMSNDLPVDCNSRRQKDMDNEIQQVRSANTVYKQYKLVEIGESPSSVDNAVSGFEWLATRVVKHSSAKQNHNLIQMLCRSQHQAPLSQLQLYPQSSFEQLAAAEVGALNVNNITQETSMMFQQTSLKKRYSSKFLMSGDHVTPFKDAFNSGISKKTSGTPMRRLTQQLRNY